MHTQVWVLGSFMSAVMAAAMPAPTPAPKYEKRQYDGLATVFSPVYSAGVISTFRNYGFDGSFTISATGALWGWCDRVPGSPCSFYTSCSSGTLFSSGGSYPCTSYSTALTQCGVEYLYSSLGARSGLSRPACFDAVGGTAITFFVSSNGLSPTTSGSTTSSSTTTSSSRTPGPTTPVPPPSSSTPVGAIVGGVVGGLAVLAIAAFAIVLLLRRRKHHQPPAAAAATANTGGEVQQYPHSPSQDPKHISYYGGFPPGASAPNSPIPPTYGPNTGFYQPPEQAQKHMQQPEGIHELSDTQMSPAPGAAPHPPHPPPNHQAMVGAHEMPANPAGH